MPDVKVFLLGDASSLQRAYRAASEATKTFGKHAETSTSKVKGLERGLTSGTSSLHAFAKSAILAGGALVGAGSVYEGLKLTVDAAEGFNVAQRQLQAQLKANGESFKAVAPWVEKLRSSQEQLGFDMTQTTDAFTKLDRASGSAAVAYKYMSTASDLARTRNIDLGLAAQLVGKIIQGNTSALNRFGIILPKNINATQALAIVNKRLAGQAAAAVTPFNKLHAALHDVEIQIGNALMPTITRYLDKVTAWLSQAKNQQRIIDFVKAAVRDLVHWVKVATGIFEDMLPTLKKIGDLFITGVKTAIDGARKAFDFLAKTFGKHKAEMILGIAAIGIAITLAIGPEAAAIVGAIVALGYIKDHWGTLVGFFKTLGQEINNSFVWLWDQIKIGALKAGLEIVKAFDFTILGHHIIPGVHSLVTSIQAEIDSIHPPNMNWSAAALQAGVATGSAYGTGFDLGARAASTAAIAAASAAIPAAATAPGATTVPGDTSVVGDAAFAAKAAAAAEKARQKAERAREAAMRKARAAAKRAAAAAKRHAALIAREYAQGIATTVAGIEGTLKQARASASKTEPLGKGSTSPLREVYDRLIAEAEKEAKDPKLSLALRTKYRSLAASEKAQLTSAIIAHRKAAATAAAAAAKKAAKETQSAQFVALGLGASGTGQSPLKETLAKELARIKKSLTGTILDTNKNTHLLTQIGKVLAGQWGTLTDKTRAAIRKLLDTIDGELKKQKPGYGPLGRVVSAESLAAKFVQPGQRKAAEMAFAQAIAHKGYVAAGPTLQGVPTVIHTHVHLDGKQIAHSVTTHQEQLGRYGAPQRRGLNAGRGRYAP